MLKARTLHRLCLSAYVMFPAIVVAWILPENSPWAGLAFVALLWGLAVAVFGALQGLLLVLGRLHLGCPKCHARSLVTGGDRDGLRLECPDCGELRLTLGRLGALRAFRPGTDEDERVHYPAEPSSPLKAPGRHPIAFAIIYLPVVGSIVAASLIHRFSFFYLLIPGFWCYGVGGFLLEAYFSGVVSDNHGTAVKRRSPIRFWGKIGIWVAFYLFAMAFPIGFALQERGKEEAARGKPAVEPATRPAAEDRPAPIRR